MQLSHFPQRRRRAARSPPPRPRPPSRRRVIRIVVPFGPGAVQDTVARTFNDGTGPGARRLGDRREPAGRRRHRRHGARWPRPPTTTRWCWPRPATRWPATSTASSAYDPVKDFTGVAYIGNSGYVIAAPGNLGVNTLADYVKLLKAKPGQFNYASAGNGSATHLGMAYFLAKAGARDAARADEVHRRRRQRGARRPRAGRDVRADRRRPASSRTRASSCWPTPARSARSSCPTCPPWPRPACPATSSIPGSACWRRRRMPKAEVEQAATPRSTRCWRTRRCRSAWRAWAWRPAPCRPTTFQKLLRADYEHGRRAGEGVGRADRVRSVPTGRDRTGPGVQEDAQRDLQGCSGFRLRGESGWPNARPSPPPPAANAAAPR